jgi:hypothetical protein
MRYQDKVATLVRLCQVVGGFDNLLAFLSKLTPADRDHCIAVIIDSYTLTEEQLSTLNKLR